MKKVLARYVRGPSKRWGQQLATAKRAWKTGAKVKVWVTTPSGAKRIRVVPFKFGNKMRYAFQWSAGPVGIFYRSVYQTKLAALKASVRRIDTALRRLERWRVQLVGRRARAGSALMREMEKP